MSTMELLTTTPAREMAPRPVMMTPNLPPVASSPSSTPTRDMTTDERMMAGRSTELNCVTRIIIMIISPTMKARPRNAWAASCSSDSPEKWNR